MLILKISIACALCFFAGVYFSHAILIEQIMQTGHFYDGDKRILCVVKEKDSPNLYKEKEN